MKTIGIIGGLAWQSSAELYKIINELVNEGKLKYWSSGSTTMYMLPSEGDVEKEEKGMNE